MNEVVKEWIQKAEGDWRTANREFEVEFDPNFDAVCFHAQQCIEKLQKAVLIARNTIPPKTHDLVELNHRLCSCFEQLGVRYSGFTISGTCGG